MVDKFTDTFFSNLGKSRMKVHSDRSVHAIEDIENHSIVLQVPKGFLISTQDKPVWDVNNSASSQLSNQDKLALLLHQQKQDSNSKFKTYIEALPTSLENMPFFWKKSTMDLIKNTDLHQKILNYRSRIHRSFASIKQCSLIPITDDEFYWARIIVASRCFSISIHGHVCSALVPYADMLNHSFTPSTRWSFDDQLDSFVMRSTRSISNGDVVSDTYGTHKPADIFLLYYGFFPAERHVISLNGKTVKNGDKVSRSEAQSILNKYPSTLDEDYLRLKSSRDCQDKLALQYLITEKQMLSNGTELPKYVLTNR